MPESVFEDLLAEWESLWWAVESEFGVEWLDGPARPRLEAERQEWLERWRNANA